eukprot:NODE_924_length_3063_cov_0.274291.p1 type:complete len:236 gc:universal NODE_924_length_3063_cov_0.274291:488-1195(+)
MVDEAIRDCKGNRFHGLPKGSLIFHNIAEAYLRLLDKAIINVLRKEYSEKGPSDFKIISRSDYYEIYFRNAEEHQVLSIVISTVARYELAINPYKKRFLDISCCDEVLVEDENDDVVFLSKLKETLKINELVDSGCKSLDAIPLMWEWAALSTLDHVQIAFTFISNYEDSIALSPTSVQRLSFMWFVCRCRVFDFNSMDSKSVGICNNSLNQIMAASGDEKQSLIALQVLSELEN